MGDFEERHTRVYQYTPCLYGVGSGISCTRSRGIWGRHWGLHAFCCRKTWFVFLSVRQMAM